MTPAPVSTQPVKVAKRVAFAEPESEINDPSLLSTKEDRNQFDTSSPFSSVVLHNESSNEDDVFVESITSHTTASDSLEFKSSFNNLLGYYLCLCTS